MELKLVPKDELADLIRASIILNYLENAGVDNWGWYGEALSDYYKDEEHMEDNDYLTSDYKTYEGN